VDQPSQPSPSKSSQTAIDRHDPLDGLVAHLVDLGIDELDSATPSLANRPEEKQFGLIDEASVVPAAVEPHHLESADSVVDKTIHDVQSSARNAADSDTLYPPLEKDLRADFKPPGEARDLGTVFVSPRQVEQQIEDRVNSVLGKRSGTLWPDSLEVCERIDGSQLAVSRGQSPSISKRH
jgi:hypothetical protein